MSKYIQWYVLDVIHSSIILLLIIIVQVVISIRYILFYLVRSLEDLNDYSMIEVKYKVVVEVSNSTLGTSNFHHR